MSEKRIVCAAIRRKRDGAIICGPRHFDKIMRSQINPPNPDWLNAEQGFIDQFGEFLTREEAYSVAESAGQIIRAIGAESQVGSTTIPVLYSEHLY